MRASQSDHGRVVLRLGKREGQLFLATLKRYPVLNGSCQPLSKGGQMPDQEASQHLLEEALAEQRVENRKQVQALLADPKRFTQNSSGCRVTLTLADAEWLLQVLNDIRVGSWVRLGCPDEQPERMADNLNQFSPEGLRDLMAMQLSGMFQMQLLVALEWGG